jgi:2-keto-4-pentenoate hydratase
MTTDYKRIERLFVEARRASRTFAVPTGIVLRSNDDAYRIQDMVFAQLSPSGRPAAWKAGAPNDQAEPTAAPIHALHGSPATLATAGMNMIGVEAEIGFRLVRDLPARAEPYREEEVAAGVGEALVTIELCDTRLADWRNAPALWKLADFQSNAALIVGTGTRDWRAIDFKQQRVELRIGERSIAAAGSHPFGSPFRLMPWIVAHCARRAGGLRAGDIVTTGSWTGLELARPGDEIVARFPAIGEAVLRLERR